MFQENVVTVKLTTITCPKCGVLFGLSAPHEDHLRTTGNSFYCPNGHNQYFPVGESEEKKKIKALEKKLAYEKEEKEYWYKSAKGEEQAHQQTKHLLRGNRAALTKVKKRVGNGVCPCCNRTFKNLQQHMAHMHPEFGQDEANQ